MPPEATLREYTSALRAWVDACRTLAKQGPVEPPPMPNRSDFRSAIKWKHALVAWGEVCGREIGTDLAGNA
jgi:hypothetical protein